MSTAAFDHIAPIYDATFTHTAIGKLQRASCWNYIEKIIPQLPGTEMLELNCGTGEDSIMFGKKGFRIIATDISEEMLRVAEKKVLDVYLHDRIELKSLDLAELDESRFNKKFDLIFSNFGGLNCIDADTFETLFTQVSKLLNPGGRFIAVVMPKYCLWETVYFMFRFQFGQAFRRWTNKKITADLGGSKIDTWYYNPATLKKFAHQKLKIITCRPIGLFLPPTYLENFFSSRKKALRGLNFLERKANFPWLSPLADHFLIDLQAP